MKRGRKEFFNSWKFWQSEHIFKAIEFEGMAVLVWGFMMVFEEDSAFTTLATVVLSLLLFSVLIQVVLGIKEISLRSKKR